ncbi:unnamed protein product [Prunus brigantina]
MEPNDVKCPYDAEIHKDCIYDFLAGLDDEFYKIRGDFLRLSPLPKLKELFVFVRKEAQCRETTLKKDGKTKSSIVMVSKALVASFSFPRPTPEEKEIMQCTYYNGTCDIEATCFHKNGFPKLFLECQKQCKAA